MAVFQPDADIDSDMDAKAEDTNFGANQHVEIGVTFLGEEKSKQRRPVVNFDVSPLSGRTINSAKLLLSQASGHVDTPFAATIRRCTRPADWTESGVTWNKYDGTNNWTAAGGDYDEATPTPKAFSVPDLTGQFEVTGLAAFVTDALNNRSGIVSLIIRADDEAVSGWAKWRAKEFGGISQWHLVIDHSGAPIGARRERGFLRGIQRGVARGGI